VRLDLRSAAFFPSVVVVEEEEEEDEEEDKKRGGSRGGAATPLENAAVELQHVEDGEDAALHDVDGTLQLVVELEVHEECLQLTTHVCERLREEVDGKVLVGHDLDRGMKRRVVLGVRLPGLQKAGDGGLELGLGRGRGGE